jgi:hypothetical protein
LGASRMRIGRPNQFYFVIGIDKFQRSTLPLFSERLQNPPF